MSKQTVQGLMLELLNEVRKDVKSLKDDVSGLKVKAAIAGGMAGLVGTGVVSVLLAYFK
jgi:hypothetical protein